MVSRSRREALIVLMAVAAFRAGGLARASEPRSVVFGEAFGLQVGESVAIEGEALRIGFEGVPADSRCPKAEECIREGDATVRIWIQKGTEPRQARDLHTSSPPESVATDPGCDVRLLRLDPYPISGRAIAPGDYVATLEVTRTSLSKRPEGPTSAPPGTKR